MRGIVADCFAYATQLTLEEIEVDALMQQE